MVIGALRMISAWPVLRAMAETRGAVRALDELLHGAEVDLICDVEDSVDDDASAIDGDAGHEGILRLIRSIEDDDRTAASWLNAV